MPTSIDRDFKKEDLLQLVQHIKNIFAHYCDPDEVISDNMFNSAMPILL